MNKSCLRDVATYRCLQYSPEATACEVDPVEEKLFPASEGATQRDQRFIDTKEVKWLQAKQFGGFVPNGTLNFLPWDRSVSGHQYFSTLF